ncbi:MAG: ABC transporter ATP-binding protein [Clostridia bacterium]|nr:ABC transporter ATP-binding protein [Clostridia bacterium]
MSNLAVKIEDLHKMYRLGTIGGGTLRGDLQSMWARMRHKEDPNMMIGQEAYTKNEKFWALKGISFEVEKGEALGLIGGNGAGKSTTLKLLSQVTAPTKGKIYLDGRVASMLEVGTGFHPELTGRENIYLNGAILGMTKTEVTRKLDEIIDFSECEKFIDTPVKRYSSGMYVKLAFSVAAHLDSEIMIMDEVLAVGDMKFQEKCINKMVDVSQKEGRTILYVSHNMNTIRQLCKRCVVLDHGTVKFDGDRDEAIELYLGNETDKGIYNNYEDYNSELEHTGSVKIIDVEILDRRHAVIKENERLKIKVRWKANKDLSKLCFRMPIQFRDGSAVGMYISDHIENVKAGQLYESRIDLNTIGLVQGKYRIDIIISEINMFGGHIRADIVGNALNINVENVLNSVNNIEWYHNAWGSYSFPDSNIKTFVI